MNCFYDLDILNPPFAHAWERSDIQNFQNGLKEDTAKNHS